MKNIKMIVVDLDETLLTTDKKVSNFTCETIKKFTDKGIIFTIASGRFRDLIIHLIPNWHLENLVDYIAYGNGFGYYNYRNGEDKTFYCIDTSIVDSIIEQFKDLDCGLFYYPGDKLYSINNNCEAKRLAKRDNIEVTIVDENFFKNIKTSKYIVGGNVETVDKICKIAKQYPGVKGFRGTPTQYEYVDSRDSKSESIKDLIDSLNIALDEIVVFGDTINDVDMLQMTPNSVAMLNGDESVKSVANYITKYTNNEDGVARFLIENIEL